MKMTTRVLPVRFARSSRFDVDVPKVLVRGPQEKELDQLKDRLLSRWLLMLTNARLRQPLRRAANDAATLAWMTPFPLLVLPVLLEEKLREAQAQAERQEEIRYRSQALIGLAA